MNDLDDVHVARECVLRYGRHSLAYSLLQPGMRHFGAPGAGCLGYQTWLGQRCVLGDPVAAPGAEDALIDAFLARGPALFMQVQAGTAALLRDRGYHITPVGTESEIDTATFSLLGKKKRDLRHYRNKARAAGLVVEEAEDTPAIRAALEPVSRAWLPTKSWLSRELAFLARPFVSTPEPGTRLFVARREGRLVAFSVLDPMYDEGRVRGYAVTILRHTLDAPEGACDFINFHVAAQLRAEAIPLLSLGVSPFHRIEEIAQLEGHGALPIYLVYRALCRWGNPIYHFRGLSFHKSRYRAREVPVYTAVKGPVGLLPLFASAKLCRMI